MATCAALTGVELPVDAAEDSFDMLPVLLGEANKPIREYTLHQTISLALAIRNGDWKYLDHKGSGGNRYGGALQKYAIADSAPEVPGQLYNLSSDPGEKNNLVSDKPAIARALKAKLEEFKSSGRSAPR